MKFLDVIKNEYASESNPRRLGIFIRSKRRSVILTNGCGEFWEVEKGEHLKVKGNLLTEAFNEPVSQVVESNENQRSEQR